MPRDCDALHFFFWLLYAFHVIMVYVTAVFLLASLMGYRVSILIDFVILT